MTRRFARKPLAPLLALALALGLPGAAPQAQAQTQAQAQAQAQAQVQAPNTAAPQRSAQANYILRCTGCHGMTGEGTQTGGVPSFLNSVSTLANDDQGRSYMMHVPGVISSSLSNAEIAAVMNWILEKWGHTPSQPFTEEEVVARRALPVADVVAYRRDLAARLEAQGKSLAPYPWP